jgi:hypothetical protein
LLIYLFDIKEFVDDEAFTATILLFALCVQGWVE